MRSTAFRALGLIGFGLAPGILLTGCGDDATGARTTLNEIQPSSYVVRPAVTTTTTAETDAENDDGTTDAPQEYEVVSGDFPMRIAERFGVSLDALANFNNWTPPSYSEFPFPGTVIRIPPGGRVPDAGTGTEGADTETESTEADTDTETTGSAPQTTLAGADGECVEGTHTITAEDTTRIRVANQYDITVEQLDAANAGTAGYSGFFPGLDIVIPCAD